MLYYDKETKMQRKKNKLIKRYETHKYDWCVAYGTWTVRIRDWMDWEQALIKEKRKPYIVDKTKLHYREYKKMERVKTDTLNICSNHEEYVVILKAYNRQIEEFDTEDREQVKEMDKLIAERDKFILQYMNSRGVCKKNENS